MKTNAKKLVTRFGVVLILIAYVLSTISGTVSAQLSQEQKDLYNAGINYYDIGFATECTGSYNGISGELGYTGDIEGIYQSGLQAPYILEMFMIHLLKRMAQISGKPETDFVTKEHVIALLAFQLGEGGDTNNSSVFNPMNGGMDPEKVLGITDTGVWGGDGGDGRRAYPSFDVGIELYARQFLKGNQSRLGYILGKPDSTAENFAHALTFYKDYEGNALWATASLDQQGYYAKELGYIKSVRKNYAARAGLVIGTTALEAPENIYNKDLIVYKDLINGDINTGETGTTAVYGCTVQNGSPTNGKFIYYNQNDEPWGPLSFPGSGGESFDKAGCGPTSYSMIAATLLQDKSITPFTFRQKIIEGGFVISGYRGLQAAKAGKEIYGLNYKEISGEQQIRTALKSGAYVISGGAYGPYQYESHIIVLKSIDANDIITIADPEGNPKSDTYPLSEFDGPGKYFVAVSR